jgi:hypothetical protein
MAMASSFLFHHAPTQAERCEARALLILARHNGDAEAVKELIDVPPPIELLLRTYAKFNPSHGAEIERMLAFRRRVLKEFERIAGKGTWQNQMVLPRRKTLHRGVRCPIGESRTGFCHASLKRL